ncbi:hypothetical protein Tdes44962_MAKER00364 [Teratosphaeria destructans]|uniref:Secreted protein n=1 Tax=Teratosphaeria destructans TaxID=418781 RepID=A0A9W7SSP7_9PEZI|nr:hypothetical protein Tdes44962_MAKER00364 [Teratosphaeria destructans]
MRPALGIHTTILLVYALLPPAALAWWNCCLPNTCGYGSSPKEGYCVPNGADKTPESVAFPCKEAKPCKKQYNGCTPPESKLSWADCSD